MQCCPMGCNRRPIGPNLLALNELAEHRLESALAVPIVAYIALARKVRHTFDCDMPGLAIDGESWLVHSIKAIVCSDSVGSHLKIT